jgi:SAM-dependent methyltransferase
VKVSTIPPTVPGGCGASPERKQAVDFGALAAAEDRHFWFQGRNHVIAAVLRRLAGGLPPRPRVLEMGCGNGNVLRVLERALPGARIDGADLFEERLSYARRRTGCRLFQADIYKARFEYSYHLIGLFDVLEHLPDDRGALRALYAALERGGRLFLTVPAHMRLWSHADRYAGHYRRYAPAGLRAALAECGFEVEHCSQFMAALTPLMWLKRRLAAGDGQADPEEDRRRFLKELRVVPGVNRVLKWLLCLEAPLLRAGWRLPLGTSVLAVARRAG